MDRVKGISLTHTHFDDGEVARLGNCPHCGKLVFEKDRATKELEINCAYCGTALDWGDNRDA